MTSLAMGVAANSLPAARSLGILVGEHQDFVLRRVEQRLDVVLHDIPLTGDFVIWRELAMEF
jgi:hypothetical protein